MRGIPITDDEKLRVCELLEEGYSQAAVARKLGIGQSTVNGIKQEMYGKDIRSMETVIAGNKKYGTLTAVGPNHYVGTCFVKNGQMKKRHFNVKGSKNAISAWESWKNTVGAVTGEPTEDDAANMKTTKILTSEEQKDILREDPPEIYAIAVDDPKIMAYFFDRDAAEQFAAISNKTLKFAGVNIRYSVIPIKPFTENTMS